MVELRKLQKTGGTTFFVTLPKYWIRQRGLGTGDLIQLLVQPGGHLLLTPLEAGRDRHPAIAHQDESQVPKIDQLEGRSVQLDVTTSPDLARDILDHYMQGADVIRIIAPPTSRLTPVHRLVVKTLTQKLVGVETIDEDQWSITLQCLINPNMLPLSTVLKRIYKIASAMHLEATQSLVTLDPDLARAVMNRDEEVDRLYFLAVRQLRTLLADPITANRVQITPLQALDHRLLAKYIELLADHATEIASIAVQIHALYAPTVKKRGRGSNPQLPSAIIRTLTDLSHQAESRLAEALAAYWTHDTTMAATLLQIVDEETHGKSDGATPYLVSLQQLMKQHSSTPLHAEPVTHNQILALLSTALSLLTRINDLATDIGGLVTSASSYGIASETKNPKSSGRQSKRR
jgi:phosphate uptake regulator